MFWAVRLTNDQTLENTTGVGAPPWTWPRHELVVSPTDETANEQHRWAVGVLPGEEGAEIGVRRDQDPVFVTGTGRHDRIRSGLQTVLPQVDSLVSGVGEELGNRRRQIVVNQEPHAV